MENRYNRIINIFEFFRSPKALEKISDLNEFIKAHPNASIEEIQEETIRLIYGEENIEWQMIFNKASALVVRLGDDQFYRHEMLDIEYSSIGFNLIISYNDEIVFMVSEGKLRVFNKEKVEWIDVINQLYNII